MTEGLNNMAAVENSSKESCRPIFFRFQRDFGLKNTSFMKGGDLYITVFFSDSSDGLETCRT